MNQQADPAQPEKTLGALSWAAPRSVWRFIKGPIQVQQNLEQNLFILVMFLSAIAGLIAFTANFILKFPPLLQTGTLAACVLFIFFLVLARRGIPYSKLVYPASIPVFAILSFIWVFNAGSRGGVQFYFFIVPLLFMVFARGAGRIIILSVYCITMAFLLTLEHTNPELIIGYSSESDRVIDVAASFIMATILAVSFVMVLHNGYRRAIKKADEGKRASELRFFETADMLPVMICETDRGLSISFINRAGCELTGFIQGDLGRGRTVLDLLHADDRARAEKDFGRTLTGGHLPLQEYRIMRKDGEHVRVLLQCGHVYAQGSVAGLRMCLIDITEKKTIEEQYHQAQKMESVGLLAGGVAHDFNNILSAVMGYATIIRMENSNKAKKDFDPKLDDQISAIIKAGDRATHLVRKLLAYSRQGSYEVNPLNIHALIDDVISLLAHSIDKRITVNKSLTAFDPLLPGDQSLLQSALLNLAVNARDAMPEGGTLTFSTACILVDEAFTAKRVFSITTGRYIAVTVSDTGAGMDDNVKAHLFEPFFTTKEPGKGTGLGLASVFGTVKRHGGFIEVDSKEGKGSSFTLYLPQRVVVGETNKTVAAAAKASRPLHVAVVDDESMICDFVKEYLLSEGYRATTFTDARKAVEWYSRSYADVDCIVLDMNMPVMDGISCFSAMRAINPTAKALFATGFMMCNTAAVLRMPGIKGYIQKPFPLKGLLDAVNRAVENGT
jgi:two-component system, cell cycle sensor histidine kinase and response regulator CckA